MLALNSGHTITDVPSPHLVRARFRITGRLRHLARRFYAAPVILLLMLFQYPIKRRFRGQIEAFVRQ
jgi:hypothetical protein